MDETVSIIIPCYNAAPFLRETLDSTLRQTRAPLEVILVDDGSTDGSADIASSYGPPVHVMEQANQGESIAMNAALAVARGRYVVFLGADDVLDPALLEAQLTALRGRAHAVACTGFAFFLEDVTKPFNVTMPRTDSFFPEVITGNLAPASCWMTPKELILQAGCYNTAQKYFEDWDLWWRVGLTGAAYIPVPMVGFYYRQHVASQLATAGDAERAYGHAWRMERMCRALLDREDLLQPHGEQLFWACCAAMRACRAFGVPWNRLSFLNFMIEQVAARRPAGMDQSKYALLVRKLGVRRAEETFGLFNPKAEAPMYRPAWRQPAGQAAAKPE
jgi:glycosyltransferase involved in cell wall biosynthesis